MKELRSIVEAFRVARAEGVPCALATVVRVCGSAYRRPGARMLVTDTGRTVGSVSGGCLEADVVRKAQHAIRRSAVEVVTYDTTDDDEVEYGVGLGCRGVVDVLIEALPRERPCYLDMLGEWLAQRRTGLVATVVRSRDPADAVPGARLLVDGDGALSGQLAGSRLGTYITAAAATPASDRAVWLSLDAGAVELFLERIEPPLPLVLFGAGRDAVPLTRLATELGWSVTLVDPRPGYAVRERFPTAHSLMTCAPEEMAGRVVLDERTVVVLMTHHYGLDRRLLPVLLPAPLRYLGLLGPRSRAERLLAELAECGFRPTADQRQRLHAPAGLDTGAETPEEIALSILAEIRAVLQGRGGGALRDRIGPIHTREGVPAERSGWATAEELEDEPRCAALAR